MANEIKYEELKALIESNQDLVLIDVRSDGEVAGGRIPGAIHIPIHTLDAALSMNPDDFKAKYGAALDVPHMVFYCQSGRRGEMAAGNARSLQRMVKKTKEVISFKEKPHTVYYVYIHGTSFTKKMVTD